jgi:hypothetical protein
MRYLFPLFGVLSYYSGITLLYIIKWGKLSRLHLYETLTGILTKNEKHIYCVIVFLLFFEAAAVWAPCNTNRGDWVILDYLQEHESSDCIIFGSGSNILWWYGEYTVLEPRSYTFYVLNNGKIELNQSSDYYYGVFCRLHIEYVYCNPHSFMNEVLHGEVKEITDIIKEDKRFQLVCESDGIQLWKIVEE